MTNIVIVITRYFGGVKLGIRGLIDAYSQATEKAILLYPLKKLIKVIEYHFSTTYNFAENLKYKLNHFNAQIIDISYSDKVYLKIIIELQMKKELEKYLSEIEKIGKIEMIDPKKI